MDLFLDTNAYLSFYRLSTDDLEELRKLGVAVKDGPTTLYITQQVRDEFRRQRESVIAESLKTLAERKVAKGFPQLFINHPGFEQLRASIEAYEEKRIAMLSDVKEAAAAGKLLADELIIGLFKLATELPVTAAIVDRAKSRFDLGNPPGKKQSYGDAINWEALLEGVPPGRDLLVVTADSDFTSPLDPAQLSEFLRTEWTATKKSSVIVYRNLTSLFTAQYPNIKLATELAKEFAIARLVDSDSFEETHVALARLAQHTDFTPQQAETLLRAANRNSQIRWILTDDDVMTFYTNLLSDYENVLDPEEVSTFWTNFDSLDEWE